MRRIQLFLKLILVPLDIAFIIFAFYLAYLYRINAQSVSLYKWPINDFLWFVTKTSPIWIILFGYFNLYSFRQHLKSWEEYIRIIIGAWLGWALFIVLVYFLKTEQTLALSRLLLLYTFITLPIILVVGRILISMVRRLLYANNIGVQRVALVGDNQETLDTLQRHLKLARREGYVFDRVYTSQEAEVLFEAKTKITAQELWFLDSQIIRKQNGRIIDQLQEKGILIKVVPDAYEVRSTNIVFFPFAGITFFEFLRSPLDGWGRIVKRLVDLSISLVAIIIISPLLALVSLGVKLTSPGPVLYCQKRIGQDGKEFGIYKFRSMYQDANSRVGHDWSVKDESKDPRITPFGLFIRKTLLDELPQLANILFGHMSFVGPRPEQPQYVERFLKEIPDYGKRHFVKSGLTGWAQVNGLRGDTSISERVKYDLYYIQHWSILFDLRILLSTVKLALKGFFSK